MLHFNVDFNIDVIIFVGFLVINLIVGISYGRKVKTMRDYALGDRNFSTAALVATIVATFVTGSSFFVNLSNTYSDGLPYFVSGLAWCTQFFIVAYFLIPRMGEFMGSLSIAEVMGNLYGKNVRLITAISGILWNVGGIAVQFKVFGNLVNYFIGIPSDYAILIASTIVIVYSAFGGIKAVTYTDVLQFFTFGFVIPLIGIIIWNRFEGLNFTLTQAFDNPIFNYHSITNLRGEKLIDFIFLALYFAFPTIGPIHFQRISMGRNIKQVRFAFIISGFLFVFIEIAMAWIPFLIATINPTLDSTQIVSYLINDYTYVGMKGLIIVGVSAMAMSSADSFINGSAVLFAHDLKETLNIRVNKLLLSKVFSIILGGIAIYVALSTKDLLTMVRSAASFYMPVVSIPLLFSILGFRSTTKSVLIAMAAGFGTVIAWQVFSLKFNCIIPATLVNLIFLFGSHYLLKQQGGWIGIKDRTYLDNNRVDRKRYIASIIKKIKDFNYLEFCKKNSPKNELIYMGLGIYFILYSFSTMYSTHSELSSYNGRLILAIYQIMMCSGTTMAMYPIWPLSINNKIKQTFVQVWWNIAIFYMLIFFSAFFVMVSNFAQLQFAIFTVNIIITALLTGWRLTLGMIMIGFILAIEFYKYYAGLESIDIAIGSPQFVFTYVLMLIGATLIIFLKPKEEEQALVIHANNILSEQASHKDLELRKSLDLKNEFLRNLEHEVHAPITAITALGQTLDDTYDQLTKQEVRAAIKEIAKNSARLSSLTDNLTDLSKLSSMVYELNKEDVNLTDLLYDRLDVCKKLYLNNKDLEFTTKIDDDVIAFCDKHYIKATFDNLIINAIQYSTIGTITIQLMKREDSVEFSIQDEGIGIPTQELIKIFEAFTVSSKTHTKSGGRGIGLALCEKVIKLHGGSISAKSDGLKGSIFKVNLPCNH